MRVLSPYDARARSFGTPPIPKPFKTSSDSCSRSAAPATRRSNLKRSPAPVKRSAMPEADIKEAVRKRYGEIARRVRTPGSSCCYDGEAGSCGISANLYADNETQAVPEEAVLASLGCGNPTALAELTEGETVLDLGSGGGIDVLLSARRVGPTGKAYGLDMKIG